MQPISSLKYLTSITLIVAALGMTTGCRELAKQPGAAVYIQPSIAPNPSMPWYFPLTQSAGDWSATPRWLVSQWGIPVDLTGSQTVATGANWNIANNWGALQYTVADKSYSLSQNGISAGSPPCGIEYDLFLAPLGQNYSTYPQGFSESKPLSQLANLGFRAGVTVVYENIQNRCGSTHNADYINYAASFIFNSTSGQTLFYQVSLRTAGHTPSGGSFGIPNMSWCPNNNDPATAHLYCVDDNITYVNGNQTNLVVGQRQEYIGDILPRVKQAIQSQFRRGDGSNEMIDGNLSRWKLVGFYIGSMIQGGANATSKWDSFCMIEQEPGDSTTNTVCTL
jgi:hypothetical protein